MFMYMHVYMCAGLCVWGVWRGLTKKDKSWLVQNWSKEVKERLWQPYHGKAWR